MKVRYPKKFKVTTDSYHSNVISPNSLHRKFDVMLPNKVWTTDTIPRVGITYVWILEGWLYVAIVMDLFSR
jgi:putative transposase